MAERRAGEKKPLTALLEIAVFGLVALLLESVAQVELGPARLPGADSDLGETLFAWLLAGLRAAPIVAAVLLLSLLFGSLLSALAQHGPSLFEALLRRLHELGGALPWLVLLMLWRLGEQDGSATSFILWLSVLHGIEVARLSTDRERRREAQRAPKAPRNLRSLLSHTNAQLGQRLPARAALITSSVFGLDAALSFVGFAIAGTPTWGTLVGAWARDGDVSGLATLLSALAMVAAIFSIHLRLRGVSAVAPT